MRRLTLIAVASLLSACANLPSDGPSGRSIDRGSGAETGALTYQVVDLDFALSERIKTAPPVLDSTLSALETTSTADTINIGDALQVSIYDPSGSLFSSRSGAGASVQGGRSARRASGGRGAVIECERGGE
jgi:polysaccharide export outer membrane protein